MQCVIPQDIADKFSHEVVGKLRDKVKEEVK
jgi:hypothetical protein